PQPPLGLATPRDDDLPGIQVELRIVVAALRREGQHSGLARQLEELEHVLEAEFAQRTLDRHVSRPPRRRRRSAPARAARPRGPGRSAGPADTPEPPRRPCRCRRGANPTARAPPGATDR